MNILPGAGRKWKRTEPREPEYQCVIEFRSTAICGFTAVDPDPESSNGWFKRGHTELRAIVRDPVQRKLIDRHYGTIFLNKFFWGDR